MGELILLADTNWAANFSNALLYAYLSSQFEFNLAILED
jgi:hypothetical protein